VTVGGRVPRGRPHHYREDPATPGVCRHCPLIRANQIHDPAKVAEAEAEQHEVQVQVRRQCGERAEELDHDR
jgi:hypothetical protein